MNTPETLQDQPTPNHSIPTLGLNPPPPHPLAAAQDAAALPTADVVAVADSSLPSPVSDLPTLPLTPPAPRESTAVTSVGILGTVDVLTELEQAQYQACEAVIALGWNSFVDVGLALADIRNDRLYRGEFQAFEDYCRARRQYGRSYVDHLISAAQVFTRLMTNSHRKPEHETQIRPLLGLSAEQAQLAWEKR